MLNFPSWRERKLHGNAWRAIPSISPPGGAHAWVQKELDLKKSVCIPLSGFKGRIGKL